MPGVLAYHPATSGPCQLNQLECAHSFRQWSLSAFSLMSPADAFLVVIPARFASSRLHGKPLADIGGKPMVVRVAERAKASGAAAVWVATDAQGVFDAVKFHGHQAMMTRADHATGTDRIAEVAQQLGLADSEIVVNVQGD